ncbi:MAG: hypothetical protein AAFY59_01185 [Pseudomonadota bacterium]
MLTAAQLLTLGGGDFAFSGKSGIKEGSGIPGFASEVITYDGALEGSVSDGKLTLSAGGSLAASEGTFIRNMDERATVGPSVKGGFLASDQFSGCDFTLLKNPAGTLLGAHVYSSENCRAAIQNVPKGWSIVGTWKSSGYIEKWQVTGLFAFAFPEGNKVKVVAMGLKGYPPKIAQVELAATFDL